MFHKIVSRVSTCVAVPVFSCCALAAACFIAVGLGALLVNETICQRRLRTRD
jgi:hypothetical protein